MTVKPGHPVERANSGPGKGPREPFLPRDRVRRGRIPWGGPRWAGVIIRAKQTQFQFGEKNANGFPQLTLRGERPILTRRKQSQTNPVDKSRSTAQDTGRWVHFMLVGNLSMSA